SLENHANRGWHRFCIFPYDMQLGVVMRFTIVLTLVVLSIGFMSAAQAQHQPAATNAPRAFGDSEFRLGPDDVVEVSVYQDKYVSVTVPVRPDGKISIPLIGEMQASGKTSTELQKEIAQRF